jgi:hypothetical protein
MGEFEDDGRTFSPLDRRQGANRRSCEDGGEPQTDGGQGLRDSGRSADRRILRHGLLYTMSGSTTVVEEWLEDHCDGRWYVMLEDLNEELDRTTIRVLFEIESDKQKFKSMILRRG